MGAVIPIITTVVAVGSAIQQQKNSEKSQKLQRQVYEEQTTNNREKQEKQTEYDKQKLKQQYIQQKATIKARFAAAGISPNSGSTKSLLDNIDKNYETDTKYAEQIDNISSRMRSYSNNSFTNNYQIVASISNIIRRNLNLF